MDDPMIRRRVLYRGRVQGVGFRATVHSAARSFRVVGYVRNLPDGRVELVAEGAVDELSRFVATVAGEMDRYILGTDFDDLPATGEFADFSIRR